MGMEGVGATCYLCQSGEKQRNTGTSEHWGDIKSEGDRMSVCKREADEKRQDVGKRRKESSREKWNK